MEQEEAEKEKAGKRKWVIRKGEKHPGGEIVGFSPLNPSPSAVTVSGQISILNIPAPAQTKSTKNQVILEKYAVIKTSKVNKVTS